MINLQNIVFDSYGTRYSSTFLIEPTLIDDDFDIIYDNENTLLVDANDFGYTSSIAISEKTTLMVRVRVAGPITSQKFSIVLTSKKSPTTITISGNIVLRSKKVQPTFEFLNAVNCSPTLTNGVVSLSLDQNNDFLASFDLPSSLSIPAGIVTDYRLASASGVDIGADASLLANAIAINIAGQKLSIELTNPNYGLSPMDPFGLINEVNYIASFTRNITFEGDVYPTQFLINLKFKSTPIVFVERSTQQAMLDSNHTKVVVAHNFSCSVNAVERQFLFGLKNEKLFNIPTNISAQIPEAVRSIGTSTVKPLNVSIIAMALTKTLDHYCLKLVVQAVLPNNRYMIAGNYEIPLRLSLRNLNHDFILPVRVNG